MTFSNSGFDVSRLIIIISLPRELPNKLPKGSPDLQEATKIVDWKEIYRPTNSRLRRRAIKCRRGAVIKLFGTLRINRETENLHGLRRKNRQRAPAYRTVRTSTDLIFGGKHQRSRCCPIKYKSAYIFRFFNLFHPLGHIFKTSPLINAFPHS